MLGIAGWRECARYREQDDFLALVLFLRFDLLRTIVRCQGESAGGHFVANFDRHVRIIENAGARRAYERDHQSKHCSGLRQSEGMRIGLTDARTCLRCRTSARARTFDDSGAPRATASPRTARHAMPL